MAPELWRAAQDGRAELVQQLLEQGADVNHAKANGWTPLLASIQRHKEDVLRLLLQYNADVEAPYPDDGYRPLHKAAQFGWVTALELLLQKGADIEARCLRKKTPLYVAAWEGKEAAVKFLISKKARMDVANTANNTPIHAAAMNGYSDVVRILVEEGMPVNARGQAERTPLYTAAMNGHVHIVQYLVEQEADPAMCTSNGWNALHITALKRYKELVEMFVRDDRLDLNGQTHGDGDTPLHKAVIGGSVEIVRILLNAGAQINCVDNSRRTPLYIAASKNSQSIVEELLKQKANVNAVTRKRWTPLHEAVSKGHKDIVWLLLKTRNERNLDLGVKNADGDTALSLAQAKGDQDMIRWLTMPDAINHQRESAVSHNSGETMAGTGVGSSDLWFQKLSNLSDVLRPSDSSTPRKKVKIAVIDSGIIPDHPNQGQVVDYRDFLTENDGKRQDATGHGSKGVELICKVLSEQDPDIYVARAFESEKGSLQEQIRVAKAIEHARETWQVDIIALACGFRSPTKELEEQIQKAGQGENPVLIFAAASNFGNREGIMYPARAVKQVICMFATDPNVKALNAMNPAPNGESNVNFAILGENIRDNPGVLRKDRKIELMHGTSFATFIAAGVAGMILDFSRHQDVIKTIIEPENLRRVRSMEYVFKQMAIRSEGYECMAPWRIRHTKEMGGETERMFIAGMLAQAANAK